MRAGGGPSFPAERVSAAAQLGNSPRRRLYSGRHPGRAVAIEDLRAMAHRRLPDFALEYLEGGAGDEVSLAANRLSFQHWRFVRRALVDVAERDLSISLFGRRRALPFAIAPTGLNGTFLKGADAALAAAAGGAGIPFAQSTMSNQPIAEVARAAPDLAHWFQLYVMRRDDINEGLIAAAEAAGSEALIITTDAQIFGDRFWSSREQSDRSHLTARAFLDAACHVRWWASTILPGGIPRFVNVARWIPRDRRGIFSSAFWIRGEMDVGLDWERVKRLRDRWPRKLLIKGMMAPQDVARAAAIGADAIVLSNHGGRQLDGALAALDALPEARAAAAGRLAVIIDGGIRSGGDILKALCLGADAVLVGRATLYGVAAAGQAGVARAIEILKTEFDHDMALLGCRSVAELGPDYLVPVES